MCPSFYVVYTFDVCISIFGQCRNGSSNIREAINNTKLKHLQIICNVQHVFLDFKMAQISTAISDFVLCISSFYEAGVIARRYNHAAIGLLIIALAAGVGTIRFLNIVPLLRRNEVISLHSKLSWFGAIVGG